MPATQEGAQMEHAVIRAPSEVVVMREASAAGLKEVRRAPSRGRFVPGAEMAEPMFRLVRPA